MVSKGELIRGQACLRDLPPRSPKPGQGLWRSPSAYLGFTHTVVPTEEELEKAAAFIIARCVHQRFI